MTLTVNGHDVGLRENNSLDVNSLINSIDAGPTDEFTEYHFEDDSVTSGVGHFTVNGVVQPNGMPFYVDRANLGSVEFVSGTSPGTDVLQIGVRDPNNQSISDVDAFIFATTDSPTDQFPTVRATTDFNILQAASRADLLPYVPFEFFIGNGGHDIARIPNASTEFNISTLLNGNAVQEVTLEPIVTQGGPPTSGFQAVEELDFTNKIMFVENSDNANIARLYSAAFDRVPDDGGLFFWEDVYANHVSAAAKSAGYYVSLAQTDDGSGAPIAVGFMQSSEFINRYGNLTDTGFVDAMYQNVLGRLPDQAGLNFWLNQLEHNGQSRAIVLVGFAESPENVAKTAGDWLISPS